MTGTDVVGLRRGGDHPGLPFPIRAADLTEDTAAALPQADQVVVTLSPDGRDAAAYEHTFRGGLAGLARRLPTPPRRLVFISSTGVLGAHDGDRVDEATQPAPDRGSAAALLSAEQDARELFDGEVVVVRPAGIYGPGRSRTIDRVARGTPMDHRRMTNRIHRDDLVTILAALLESSTPPPLLHAVDAEPATLGAVASFIAERLGADVPADSGDGRASGKTIDGRRLRTFLQGSRLRFPTFREGYAELIGRHDPTR